MAAFFPASARRASAQTSKNPSPSTTAWCARNAKWFFWFSSIQSTWNGVSRNGFNGWLRHSANPSRFSATLSISLSRGLPSHDKPSQSRRSRCPSGGQRFTTCNNIRSISSRVMRPFSSTSTPICISTPDDSWYATKKASIAESIVMTPPSNARDDHCALQSRWPTQPTIRASSWPALPASRVHH